MSGVTGLSPASCINNNHQIQLLTHGGGGGVQSLSRVRLCPHGPQHARLPSFTISQSLLKLMCIESVMPSNHLIRKESDIFGAPCVQYEKAHSGCSRNVELLSLHLPFPYCRLHDCGAAHKHLEGGLAHSGSTARNC